MKRQADERYLPASSLILLGIATLALSGIARPWTIAGVVLDAESARTLAICLIAGGLALLARHYHPHRGAPKRKTGTGARPDFRYDARSRRAEGDAS